MTEAADVSERGWRRDAVLITCVVATLACGFAVAQGVATQRAGARSAQAGPLWVSESTIDEGRRLLIVVDSATRHAAVYHVDPGAGTVALRSTRDLSWDLVLEDFNAQEPTPAALRRMLEGGQPPAAGR
ncbi:MAG: hypothetical protein EBS51_13975 [Planctomycetia bacterium]|jgi:anti-sigma-K factor RskA|nr:hypothetical protein [Planctomycetia bacterium]